MTALEKQIAADRVEFVRFEQSDTHGISRSKTIPVDHVRGFAEAGLNFLLGQLGFDVQAGVAPNTGYLEELGFPDSRLHPDLSTYRVLPWADKTARLLCEPCYMDNRPAMAAPRTIARKLLAELQETGYRLLSGFEYEFYLVHRENRQPPFVGIQIFSTLRNNFDESLVYQILRGMKAVGVDIITSNAEYGPGQMEINFAPKVGIEAADNAFTFKNGVKEIAQRHGYMASFMTKPYADQSANGCHVHQSLLDVKTGRNAFASADASLTDVCRWWLGGQIAHAAALCALAAPTVNCPKRYRLYSFAPTNATWGVENRTAGFRMKYLGGQSAHIENRLPGGGSNPYRVMAGVLAAGLDGLKNKTEPPAETEGMAYGLTGVVDLPTRLEQSVGALETDGAMRAALGEEFMKLFVAVKRHEIGKAKAAIADYDSPDFNNTVHEWERSEYFEFL
ncbi:MAG: glutamine synthetase family protein [Candidatus Rokuibacteriota bacterium]